MAGIGGDIPVVRYRGNVRVPIDEAQVGESGDLHRKSYLNRTNIDWSYEYRLEEIQSGDSRANGIVARLVQRSSKLLVLVLMGVVIGPVAILIDVLSRYLNDIKYGVCVQEGHYKLLSRVQCGEDNWESWSDIMFGAVESSKSVLHFMNNYIIYVLGSLTFAYLTTLLVKQQPFTKYSGISELKIILSGFVLKNFLNAKVLLTKSLGLILVIGSGIWVGKEGPVVHVAGCIAHMIIQLFPRINRNEALKREMIVASTAAGIGVAFNAPIGGVLFCLEQVKTYFPIDRMMWNSFVCATISVLILQSLHPFSDLIYDQIFKVSNDSQNWLRYEIIPFMILGVVGGYLGILFNKLNYKFAEVRSVIINNSLRSKILEVVAVAMVTAIISFPFGITRIPLTELISVLFSDCKNRDLSSLGLSNDLILSSLCYETDRFPWMVIFLLLMASIQGFALSAYSYGTFVPGGVLMPSLTIGALIGRLLGTLVEFFQFKFPQSSIFTSCSLNLVNCITPGSYAVVGALSFLSSVTKMSVSVVVILFELTGALNYVIPIMIGVLLSRFISDLYSDKSCYELWLKLQDYPYLRPGLDEEVDNLFLSILSCEDFLKPVEEIVAIYNEALEFDSLNDLVNNYSFTGFPVLNNREEKKLLGWCSRRELYLVLIEFEGYTGHLSFEQGGIFNKILSQTEYTILPSSMPILTAYALFDKLSLQLLFFCYPNRDLVFKSLMTKKDLIEIIELKDRDLMDKRNEVAARAYEEEEEIFESERDTHLEEFIIDDDI